MIYRKYFTFVSGYSLRLYGGGNTGRVIISFANATGRICPDGWDDNDAQVSAIDSNQLTSYTPVTS